MHDAKCRGTHQLMTNLVCVWGGGGRGGEGSYSDACDVVYRIHVGKEVNLYINLKHSNISPFAALHIGKSKQFTYII